MRFWTAIVAMTVVSLLALRILGQTERTNTNTASANTVAIDADDIGGIVTSSQGAEAGVWVIAENMDLPTKFRKIAVTDDAGRYVIPDLPDAKYRLWVRGYGLVDSEPVQTNRGQKLTLKAVVAPTARAAAQYYSSDYWLSLIQIPPKSDFPMTVDLSPHTCAHAHHVRMGEGKNKNVVFFNGLPTGSLSYMDLEVLQKTGSEQAAQGWCRGYYDIDGNGKVDPKVDRPVQMNGVYSVIPDPTDDTVVWGAVPGTPGKIVRMKWRTCVAEAYEPPFNNSKAAKQGFFPRGIDIDRNGLVWTALAGSGHLASFDRRKCKVLTGEAATTGQHCPEGWTLYPLPGPRMKGVTDEINSDFHYYNFVDQFNTLGLGANVPIATGSGSDSLIAVLPGTGETVVMRVPYPMGYLGTRVAWHTEGGKGTPTQIAHFQIRPNPLAK